MKALVIGFGKMGMLHTSILNTVIQPNEIFVIEPISLLRNFIRKAIPSLNVFSNLNDIDLKSIDLAIITSPTGSHYEIISKIIEYNVNIFVEKPIVSSLEECNSLLQLIKKINYQKVIMVGNCYRFSDSFEQAKKIINEINLNIKSFYATFFSSDVLRMNKGWRYKEGKIGSGVILDLGIHVIDLVRYIFGKPVVLESEMSSIFSSGVDDQFASSLKYDSFLGKINCSWSNESVRKPTLNFEIFFDDSTNLLINEDQIIHRGEDNKTIKIYYSSENKSSVPFDLAGGMYTKQLIEFNNSVINGSDYRNNLNEAFENHIIIDEIVKLSS